MTDRGPLDARVSVAESKVASLEQEEMRTRSRLHDLESDRATPPAARPADA